MKKLWLFLLPLLLLTPTAQAATRVAIAYPWFPQAPFGIYHPTLTDMFGTYDSSNQALVDKQLVWQRFAKIEVDAQSWWGIGQKFEQDRIPLLLNRSAAIANAPKQTVYYEDEGYGNPSQATIESDLAYLANYASHPRWYRDETGRPVIWVYNVGDGCEVASKWKAAAPGWHVVLKVFSGWRDCAVQPDSWHQYSPSSRTMTHSPHYFSVSAAFCHYNESTCRLPRDLVAFKAAVRQMVATNVRWHMVFWNEFGEGTAIESAREWRNTPTAAGWYVDALSKDGL